MFHVKHKTSIFVDIGSMRMRYMFHVKLWITFFIKSHAASTRIFVLGNALILLDFFKNLSPVHQINRPQGLWITVDKSAHRALHLGVYL